MQTANVHPFHPEEEHPDRAEGGRHAIGQVGLVPDLHSEYSDHVRGTVTSLVLHRVAESDVVRYHWQRLAYW